MTIRLGLIVESPSDQQVVAELLRKLGAKPFSTKSFIAHGCGKLMAKCTAWAEDLSRRGCSALLVVQDRDDKDLATLQAELNQRIAAPRYKLRAVVVPVRELEAWLIADPRAVEASFELNHPIPNTPQPERDPDPKKRLFDLIYAASDKRVRYVNAVHNHRIATRLDVTRVANSCPSLHPLRDFARAM